MIRKGRRRKISNSELASIYGRDTKEFWILDMRDSERVRESCSRVFLFSLESEILSFSLNTPNAMYSILCYLKVEVTLVFGI